MMDDLNRRAASRAKHLRTEMRRESVRVVARVRPDDAPIPQSEERVTHTETVVEVTPSSFGNHLPHVAPTFLIWRPPSLFGNHRALGAHLPHLAITAHLAPTFLIWQVAAEHRAMTPLRFVLDGVTGPTEDQEGAYATIAAGATEGVLLGRSCAIIAVGAPSSGKTYSLFGPAEILANATGSSWKEWGLLPRASHHLFSRASAIGGIEGLLGLGGSFACSFVEICGEQAIIYSLLLWRPGRDQPCTRPATARAPGVPVSAECRPS